MYICYSKSEFNKLVSQSSQSFEMNMTDLHEDCYRCSPPVTNPN